MFTVNAKQSVMLVGVVFVFFGFLGFVNVDEPTVPHPAPGSRNGQSALLEVRSSDNFPTSTIDLIQGLGGLQSQGGQPQGFNVGEKLQPNAGVDNLSEFLNLGL